ncbi:hypothetical protein FKM82_023668 [Ascaphus truei]
MLQACFQCALFFFIQTLLAFLFFSSHILYKRSPRLTEPPDTQMTTPRESELLILLWTWPFGTHFPLNQCPKLSQAPGCFFTANRSLYSSASAVIFHHRDVCRSRTLMPQIPRPKGQYWVWFNMESPSQSPNLGLMDNLINLTMSYRTDSDIFTPYGYLQTYNSTHNFTFPEKSQLVAWAVSNWNPHSRRVQYYEELTKYINIDVYGRQHIPLASKNLHTTLSKYKFYLSFENSIHKDYITEKLWKNALISGTVPVVLGPPRENYERFLPRDSFIHVEDFPTAGELAAYLLALDKDNQRYQQYFNWRSHLQPLGYINWIIHYCKTCKALKEAPSYRTTPSLTKWYT